MENIDREDNFLNNMLENKNRKLFPLLSLIVLLFLGKVKEFSLYTINGDNTIEGNMRTSSISGIISSLILFVILIFFSKKLYEYILTKNFLTGDINTDGKIFLMKLPLLITLFVLVIFVILHIFRYLHNNKYILTLDLNSGGNVIKAIAPYLLFIVIPVIALIYLVK